MLANSTVCEGRSLNEPRMARGLGSLSQQVVSQDLREMNRHKKTGDLMKFLTRKNVALATVLLAIAPTVSGCSSFVQGFQDGFNSTQTYTFDVKALEEDLAYNIQVDTDVVQFVTCPESMSGTLGAEWTCWTEDEWGFGSDVFVTLTGLDGTYLYDVANF